MPRRRHGAAKRAARDYEAEVRACCQRMREEGVVPSLDRVSQRLGADKSRVADVLRKLRESGELEAALFSPGRPRGVHQGKSAVGVEFRPGELDPACHADKIEFYEHLYSLDEHRVAAWRAIRDRYKPRRQA